MKISRKQWVPALVLGAALATVPLQLFAQGEPAEMHEPGTHALHEENEEAHGETGPAPINWTEFGHQEPGHHGEAGKPQPPFVATVVNFLLLFAILYFAVRRGINPLLADRRAAIEAEIGEAQRLRSEAEVLHREYTERLAKMDEEFAALKTEFMRLGEQEYQRIVDEAKSRAERMAREGEIVIQQEVRQLRSDLMREAVDAAVSSAEGTIKKSVTSADHSRMADDYAAELEQTRGASA